METGTPSEELMQRWRNGDQAAASELYERYVQQLYNLASRQMSVPLLRRVGPDDIVQSVFRTFFRRAEEWRFQPDRAGAIWHLLVRITLNKIRSKGIHHGALKRDVRAEVSDDATDFEIALVAHDPTPVEAAALCEVLEMTFASLDDQSSQILQLAIQGHTASEIAAEAGCSRWTVRRVLDRIGHDLQQQFEQEENS